MSELLTPVLTWLAGAGLGTLFFGGLWWTVQKTVSSRQPARWIFGSLIARMSMALAGFYFVSDRQWERLLLCVIGFAMARPAVTWLTRPAEEVRHAP